jgi:hypothetical protein
MGEGRKLLGILIFYTKSALFATASKNMAHEYKDTGFYTYKICKSM